MGFLLACLTAFLFFAILQPQQVWTLSDGSKLRFVKATWGTNHVCRYGNRLIDSLYPFIPARYRTNFKFQVTQVSTAPQERLVIWMERTAPTNNGSVATLTGRRFSGLSTFETKGAIFMTRDSGGGRHPSAGRLLRLRPENASVRVVEF